MRQGWERNIIWLIPPPPYSETLFLFLYLKGEVFSWVLCTYTSCITGAGLRSVLGEEKDKRNEDFYNLQLTKAIYFPNPLAQFCWPWSSQSSWFVLSSVQCQEIKEENKTIGNSSPLLFKFWRISSIWVLLFIFQNPYFFIYSFIHLLFLFCSECLVLLSGRIKLQWDSFILVRNRDQCKSF